MDRIFVRFKSELQKIDALQSVALLNEPGAPSKFLYTQPNVLVTAATDNIRAKLTDLGAEIFEDVRFSVLPGWDNEGDDDIDRWTRAEAPSDLADDFSLQDVIKQVRAPEAWEVTTGQGSTIVVVDTGIAAGLQGIARERRSPIDLPTAFEGNHWSDTHGHGSMCAAIAAASRAEGGRYDGIAPGARVLAAKSTLYSTDLADIYDELIRARSEGRLAGPVIVSNSYGLYACSSPQVLPENHPYVGNILAAVENGIFVCFAAGNNHNDECKHDPMACGPNSIWDPNSHDHIISVGTVNRELTNCDLMSPHVNSSRGPGEWARATVKPDCVAPTYGEVNWGTSYRRMRWWGTSGACPQVAGAAALVMSSRPLLTPQQVGEIITGTCARLPEGRTCVGAGVIDCATAVENAASIPVSS